VAPRGPDKFGWDPIFLPDDFDQTFAEMNAEQKNMISMRRQALEKLKNSWLQGRPQRVGKWQSRDHQ
jgi:inosine/xanthosine triphosphate pyrophosphatase family protein